MRKAYNELMSKIRSKTRAPHLAPIGPPPRLTDNEGFEVIYEPIEASVDIVAIHGHGGHRKASYTDRETGTFWLRDFLPSLIPAARILSFGYDTSDTSVPVETIASRFLAALISLREEMGSSERPIVFIAHSFGGLLLKGALALMPHRNIITDHTRGLIYLGVPKSALHAFRSLPTSSLLPDPADTPYIMALKRDMVWLQEQVSVFERLCGGWLEKYFVESDRGLEVLKTNNEIGVSKTSEDVRMNKTHGAMIRFSSIEDKDFKMLAECLINMVDGAMNFH